MWSSLALLRIACFVAGARMAATACSVYVLVSVRGSDVTAGFALGELASVSVSV